MIKKYFYILMSNNRIHNTNRSPASNHITTFLDRNLDKFKDISKCSQLSTNLNFYYDYCQRHYQKFSQISKKWVSEYNLKEEKNMDLYFSFVGSGMAKIIKLSNQKLVKQKKIKSRKFSIKNFVRKFYNYFL